MLFILALAVAVLGGALAYRAAEENRLGTIARLAAAVAGAIAGYVLVHFISSRV